MHDWITVKRVFKSGVNISQAAKRMNISRNTVKRQLKEKLEPRYPKNIINEKIHIQMIENM